MTSRFTCCLIALFALALAACAPKASAAPETPPAPEGALALSDLAVYPADAVYVYEGDTLALGDWHVFPDYISETRVQKRFLLDAATTLEVLEMKGGALTQIYGMAQLKADGRITHADTRNEKPNADVVLLKEPIAVGTRWVQSEQAGNGVYSEITSVDTEITVPYGTFHCVEVTTVHEAGVTEQRDYYAPGVGLVQVSALIFGNESASRLSDIMTEQTLTETFALFYPDTENAAAFVPMPLTFHTNDTPEALFAEAAAALIKERFGQDLSDVGVGAVSVDPDGRQARVDLTGAVYAHMNRIADAEAEAAAIKCAANSFGYLLDVDAVLFTVNGGAYKSDRVTLGAGDYVAVTVKLAGESDD